MAMTMTMSLCLCLSRLCLWHSLCQERDKSSLKFDTKSCIYIYISQKLNKIEKKCKKHDIPIDQTVSPVTAM